jgi:predicted ATPase
MISEIFCIPPSLTTQLSSLVFHKTAGAPIYVLNFLRSLCEEGLIQFALTTRRWEYQLEGIRGKELPHGVVQYMRSQMLKLPQSHRLVLKVAACLGHRFDYSTFQVRAISSRISSLLVSSPAFVKSARAHNPLVHLLSLTGLL